MNNKKEKKPKTALIVDLRNHSFRTWNVNLKPNIWGVFRPVKWKTKSDFWIIIKTSLCSELWSCSTSLRLLLVLGEKTVINK